MRPPVSTRKKTLSAASQFIHSQEHEVSQNQLVIRFLNVGQGDSTHLILPNGDHVLIDINLDHANRGIDVIQYLADALPAGGKRKKLAYNVNTHPHDDHIRGTGALGHDFEIGEMWHSGHELDCEPGENPEYDKFKAVLEDLGDRAIKVCAKPEPWHEIAGVTFHVFRPSKYVKVKKNDSDKRGAVHDECMVLKVSFAGRSIMFTGDSDMAAWKNIMRHYNTDDLLRAVVLHASHHGSRSFFKSTCEEDPAYTDHLDAINPEFLILSVGTKNEHEHPHADAMKPYARKVTKEKTYRSDKNLTIGLTIAENGIMTWSTDDADFQREYQLPEPDSDKSDTGKGDRSARIESAAIVSKTRLGDKSPTA
jgi:competence protein ComEC